MKAASSISTAARRWRSKVNSTGISTSQKEATDGRLPRSTGLARRTAFEVQHLQRRDLDRCVRLKPLRTVATVVAQSGVFLLGQAAEHERVVH